MSHVMSLASKFSSAKFTAIDTVRIAAAARPRTVIQARANKVPDPPHAGVTANLAFGSDGKGYVNIYDRKGLQVMLSNFVRIRKQFGVGWFLFQLLFYIADIPVFFLAMLLSRLVGKASYTWTQFRQYCRNVWVVIRKSPKIIRNKPYFYKVI